MLQRVCLIGNLGNTPQLRYTPDGVPVTDFRLATTRTISKVLPGGGERPCPQGYKESYNGKNWEVTTWWTVTCWRGLAETVAQFLTSGRQVYVEGEMSGDASDGIVNPRIWQGNDGEHRASFELTAETVKFLGSPGSGTSTTSGPLPLDPPPAEGWED